MKIGVAAAGYIGGWIVIVIGWRVAWLHNQKREIRKEMRELVDRLIDLVHAIERDAVTLLTSAPSATDSNSALSIRSGLDRLSRALSRIRRENKYNCRDQMIHFRQAITSGDMDSANRAAVPATDVTVKNIGIASLILVDQMENEFTRLYHR